ncbi:MAG: hemolysin III family protein [Ilumatobacter sp.]|uniref:PAQR family membrane homeostasis protein TrhA n=1 Tax=Ilumatobacter sp. TaxID=1967498 RepID=UPI002608BB1E|nr:hemolysin III family protein [Ilumatobacter sp.]MDJ0768866.1 hemolysin III family protein [Ilumatobacter sp.]
MTTTSSDTLRDGRTRGATAIHERPTWRGRLHVWAFVVSLPAAVALIALADGKIPTVAAALFAGAVVLLFGSSAAYHRLTRTERSKRIMQRVDHSMIYILIAGTYAPLCLVALPRSWGIPVLVAAAAVAAAGIGLRVFAFERTEWLGYALYPIMGGAGIIVLPMLIRHLSAGQLALIVTGGLTYGVGVLILFHRRPDPWPRSFGYHEIWHALTVLAAALHFVAIADLLT